MCQPIRRRDAEVHHCCRHAPHLQQASEGHQPPLRLQHVVGLAWRPESLSRGSSARPSGVEEGGTVDPFAPHTRLTTENSSLKGYGEERYREEGYREKGMEKGMEKGTEKGIEEGIEEVWRYGA